VRYVEPKLMQPKTILQCFIRREDIYSA